MPSVDNHPYIGLLWCSVLLNLSAESFFIWVATFQYCNLAHLGVSVNITTEEHQSQQ